MADVYMTVAGAGLKNGTDWDNAYDQTQMQAAADDVDVAGEILYVEADTYTVPAIIDLDQGTGTYVVRCGLIAVNKTTHVEDGSRAVFDCNSIIASALKIWGVIDYWDFKNFEVINATSDGIIYMAASTRYNFFYNVRVYNCGNKGLNSNGYLQYSSFLNCAFNSNTSQGIYKLTNSSFLSGQAINNGADGIYYVSNVVNSILHGNTTQNITLYVHGALMVNNVIDGTKPGTNTAKGINLDTGHQHIWGNRITHHSDIGLDGGVVFKVEDNNYFYDNSGGDVSGDFNGGYYSRYSGVNTGDGYKDLANDDFTLTAGADGVGVETPVGLPDEAVNKAFITQGIPPECGAGGGLLVHPGMTGGINA